MKNTLFIASTNPDAGLTSVTLGLYRMLDQAGINIGFCKPIVQDEGEAETSIQYLSTTANISHPKPLTIEYARSLIIHGKKNELLEKVIEIYHIASKEHDVMLVEGLINTTDIPFANKLNSDIAKALDARVILVCNAERLSYEDIDKRVAMGTRVYKENNNKLLGIIINKANSPLKKSKKIIIEPQIEKEPKQIFTKNDLIKNCHSLKGLKILGFIPWEQHLNSPRTIDIAKFINAKFINQGEAESRRVEAVQICAATFENFYQFLKPNALLISPGDRDDVLLTAFLSTLNGTPLAGIVLTGNINPNKKILEIGSHALKAGLPIMLVPDYTYKITQLLNNFEPNVKANDVERIEEIMNYFAKCIYIEKITEKLAIPHKPRLSPPAFRYLLLQKTKSISKKIVLPEGEEPRIIQAAIECQNQNIAKCILLGKKDEIEQTAKALGLEIPSDLEIIDPISIRNKYIEKMIELRKHKGMTEEIAKTQLEDPIVVGTMMLANGDVDGLVAGAITTTANTVRPALQFIKTKPNTNIVSSVFFMCLPEQVIVYGDCAINTNPTAIELADIAIQSNDSAKAFGIDPLVAMISYSTGASGTGVDVKKVIQATNLVKEKRPDIIIDGPLQYDAATVKSVAKKKAPGSKVAGNATVCIFPDLNTGNTTYKAVQRSANVVSIGPMLQGLRKPVNDLSRGASVEDIIYTIAITVIQAQGKD